MLSVYCGHWCPRISKSELVVSPREGTGLRLAASQRWEFSVRKRCCSPQMLWDLPKRNGWSQLNETPLHVLGLALSISWWAMTKIADRFWNIAMDINYITIILSQHQQCCFNLILLWSLIGRDLGFCWRTSSAGTSWCKFLNNLIKKSRLEVFWSLSYLYFYFVFYLHYTMWKGIFQLKGVKTWRINPISSFQPLFW